MTVATSIPQHMILLRPYLVYHDSLTFPDYWKTTTEKPPEITNSTTSTILTTEKEVLKANVNVGAGKENADHLGLGQNGEIIVGVSLAAFLLLGKLLFSLSHSSFYDATNLFEFEHTV